MYWEVWITKCGAETKILSLSIEWTESDHWSKASLMGIRIGEMKTCVS